MTSGDGRLFAELYARRRIETSLAGSVRPLGFEAPGTLFDEKVRVEVGWNRLELGLRLPRPRLWWTWDRGGQPLYELGLSCGGEVGRVRFGVRSVELRDWNVYLNGGRIFLRGANSLPADAYPARASEERWRADAALVRDAGMNAVRVHAHVADQSFYAACDELGLLVIQDFPLQWTHRKTVLSPAVAQAGEMARALRSHPCVGIYLAHDEPFYVAPPEKWTYLGVLRTAAEVLAPRWASWQRRVLDPAIVETLEREDSSVPVIDAAGHPTTTNHLYFGWYYGKYRDLERLVGLFPGFSRLPTEYGAQALPDPESLREIWPEGQGPDWDALSSVYRLQAGRMRRYVPWRGDRDRYVRESQVYQAEVLKHATEYFRRRKYRPTGGTFAFMLNDPAPAISWSVLDWRRRPKRAFEALRAAMSPVLICSRYPKESYPAGRELSLPLFVVNDFSKTFGTLEWAWKLDLDGAGVARGSGWAEIGADSVTRIGRAAAMLPGPGRATLSLSLRGDGVHADNAYEFFVKEARRP